MPGPNVSTLWRSEGVPDQLNFEKMFEEESASEEGCFDSSLDAHSAHSTMDLPLNASKLLFERKQSIQSRSRSPSPRSGASSRSSSPVGRRVSAVGMDSPIAAAVNPVGKHLMRTCAVWAVALAAFTTAAMKAPKLTRSVELDCSSLLSDSRRTAMHSLLRPQCNIEGESHLLLGVVARKAVEEEGCEYLGDHDLSTMRLRGGIQNDMRDCARLRGGMEDVCQGCAKAGFEGRRGFEMLRESAARDKPVRPKLSRTVDLH